jgi:hypothetical protein
MNNQCIGDQKLVHLDVDDVKGAGDSRVMGAERLPTHDKPAVALQRLRRLTHPGGQFDIVWPSGLETPFGIRGFFSKELVEIVRRTSPDRQLRK